MSSSLTLCIGLNLHDTFPYSLSFVLTSVSTHLTLNRSLDHGLHHAIHAGVPHQGVLDVQVGCHLALCYNELPAFTILQMNNENNKDRQGVLDVQVCRHLALSATMSCLRA